MQLFLTIRINIKLFLVILTTSFFLIINIYAAEQTKARYEKIAQKFTKNLNTEIKPMMMKMA